MKLLLTLLLTISLSPLTSWGDTLGDRQIKNAVEREMLYDASVNPNKIDTRVKGGIVILSGTSSNIIAKERASTIAQTVKGVKSVVNNIKVDTKYVDPKVLKKNIAYTFFYDPAVDSYELSVTANPKGEVTLNGSVQSYAESRLAENVAKSIEGVTAVKNYIKIEYRDRRKDSEIRQDILGRLKWDALVDNSLIDVKVKDGKVKLTGTVGSAAERSRAHFDAWVMGVQSVDSDGIEVAKWMRDENLRKGKFTDKSDTEIRNAVLAAFLWDPRVYSFKVDVEVENGVATLRGTVDNLKARQAANRDALNTVGVVSVKNYLKVRPAEKISEEKLKRIVDNAIERNPYFEAYNIITTVDNDTVVLNGVVSNYFEKSEVEETVSRIRGVAEVKNNLLVGSETTPLIYNPYAYGRTLYDNKWYNFRPSFTVKTDKEIERDIESEIFWSPFIDREDVNIDVENGVATLGGEVNSWSEYRAASQNAYEGGAIKVVNKITVVGI